MDHIRHDRLSFKQKWQLALSLVVLYYPVILYLDFPVYRADLTLTAPILLYQFVTGIVILVVFWVWINLSEWVLDILSGKLGYNFILEFRLPAVVVTFFIAAALSFSFILVTREIMSGLDAVAVAVFQTHFLISFPEEYPPTLWELYKRANFGFFLLFMLSAFYLIANRKATLRIKDISLKTERLEKENAQAQLAALKSQVDPHFLFNSLSILSSLVHENTILADTFIQELSKTYRYILEQRSAQTVLVKDELIFIESYIFLLTIRFQYKLHVKIEVEDAASRKYKIAPMTLQLLIENAVKHNQMSDKVPLRIRVYLEEGMLLVCNNLNTRSIRQESSHTGLQNIIDRYQLLTERAVFVEATDDIFMVKIPLLTE